VFAGPALGDDFSLYPEGSDGGPSWRVQAGTWRIERGELVGQDCGTDAWRAEGIAWGQPTWRDYRLRVRFKIDSRGSDWRDGPWFGIRCDDEGNGYYLNFSIRDVQLHKASQGRCTSDRAALATAPFRPDTTWHTLELSARAGNIEAKLDGKPLLRANDENYLGLSPRRAGFIVLAARKWSKSTGTTRIRFDNVEITLIP